MSNQLGVIFSTQFPTLLSPGTLQVFAVPKGEWHWQLPLGSSARALIGDQWKVCIVDRDNTASIYRVQLLDILQRRTDWSIPLSTSLKLFPAAISKDAVIIAEEQQDSMVLYALESKNGSERWRASLPNACICTLMGQWLWPPHILGDMLLLKIIGEDPTYGSAIVALDLQNGNERWRLTRNADLSQPHPLTSTILLVSIQPFSTTQNSELLALDRVTGTIVWNQSLDGHYDNISSPAVSSSRFYLGVFSHTKESGSVMCFDTGTGKSLWKTTIDAATPTTPVLDQHDNLYVGTRIIPSLRSVTKLDAAYGRIQWRVAQVPPPLPPVPTDHLVYIGAETFTPNDPSLGQCMALDAGSGATVWTAYPMTYPKLTNPPRIATGGPGYHFAAAPKLTQDGQRVVFAQSPHELMAVDATTGAKHWQLHLDEDIRWYELV